MTERNPILDYATPPRQQRAASIFTPKNVAVFGAILALVTVVIPFDVGSGRVIVNPLRFIGCAGVVASAVLYAMLRIWHDPAASIPRRTAFTLCLIVATVSFCMAHSSVWGGIRLPPYGLQFTYWRWILVMLGTSTFACIFSAGELVQKRFQRLEA